MNEISNGDASSWDKLSIIPYYFHLCLPSLYTCVLVIVTHPVTLTEEMKIVRMVLSNISMSISSGFTSDLITTSSFR